jgi:Domain of unknown function (DUF4388)
MSLSGNLRTMALPEILQWVSLGRKTGTLHLERRSITKRIVFREGHIITSTSTDPKESLGQFLIRKRRVTEEQLFKALLRQEKEGRLIGEILVGEGLLAETDLRECLRLKAEETIYDLFLWPDGAFEFLEGELPDNLRIEIDLGVTTVVMEGVRRIDEWSRIREVFPSGETTFRINAETPGNAGGLTQRDILGLCAAGKSLAEISLELRRSEFEAASLIFELYDRGVVAVDRIGEPDARADTVEAIQRLLAVAREHFEARRYEDALEAYEAVLSLDRINQVAKKGLVATVEARVKQRALKAVPLDAVPILCIDMAALTKERFDPQEGFVLSRINGEWDVQSILKLCPLSEEDVLLIFSRLLERKVIELKQ